MPTLHTWAGTGSAVAQVDPCFPAVVAGLVALLRPAVGAELADPQHHVEEAGKLGSRRFIRHLAFQVNSSTISFIRHLAFQFFT
jgi:hypothetical protein